MKRLILIYLILSNFVSNAQINLFVDSSRAISGSGTSWATAYKTLNEALNLANTTSISTKYIIRIAQGTYYPTGAQSGINRDSTFALIKGGIQIYGGYPSGGGIRDITANPTILSGDIGLASDSTDNSYHVMVIVNVPAAGDSIIIDGLSMMRGNANGPGGYTINSYYVLRTVGAGLCIAQMMNKTVFSNSSFVHNVATDAGGGFYANTYFSLLNSIVNSNTASTGGGIYSGVQPNMYGCTISQNVATGSGGGLLALGSPGFLGGGEMLNDTFSGNKANNGAGMYITNGIRMTGCLVENNIAANIGGGICCIGSFGEFKNFMVRGNKAANGGGIYMYNLSGTLNMQGFSLRGNSATNGGGMYLISSSPTISNSLFCGNLASNGGGLYSSSASSAAITNCTFSGDSALNGQSIVNSYSVFGPTTISNCIIWDPNCIVNNYPGQLTISNTIIQGGASGIGNTNVFPQFVNPAAAGLAPTLTGDYSLTPCSPAINTGQNTGSYNGVTDVTGNLRLFGTTIDKGAYEYQGSPFPVPSASGDSFLCLNRMTILQSTQSGGIWSTSDSTVATINGNTGALTGIAPGTVEATYTLTASVGCTTSTSKTVSILAQTTDTINAVICPGSSYLLGSQNLTTSGTYTHVFPSAAVDCDSTITLNLTVALPDTGITQNGNMLTSNQAGATYQWINCAHGNAIIAGATGQTFTPATNGQYAVIITRNGCTDTSACRTVSNVGTFSVSASVAVEIYPNPVTTWLTITAKESVPDNICIYDMTGILLQSHTAVDHTTKIDMSRISNGVYLVVISCGAQKHMTSITVVH